MKKNMVCFLLIACLASCNKQVGTSGLDSSSPSMSIPSDPDSNKESNTRPERPHSHYFGAYEVVKKATLFEKGIKERKCISCDEVEQIDYYDLDEVVFADQTFQYSGQEKTLLIQGLLPEGIRVEYKNNKRTEIGNVEATADFIDLNNQIVETRKATLTITDYTGFPEIRINTLNNAAILSKETYVPSSVTVGNCDSKYLMNQVSAGVRLRGNGTLEADKKPYRIKFDSKQNLLGLNDGAKMKSWVLLADYYDASMLRNATAFYLGNSLFNYSDNYCSSYQHVNLYLNGIYNGVYLLAEQQQVNKNRVDIYEPESNEMNTDIGYLLELDSYALDEGDYIMGNMEGYTLKDSNGSNVNLSSYYYTIKSDYYSAAQKNFIEKYINNVFTILYDAIRFNRFETLNENYEVIGSDYDNLYDTLNAVIDLDSLIKVSLFHEIMKSVDIGFSSFYLWVDFSADASCRRLTFGAPWDFDWSSGNVTGDIYYNTTGKYCSLNFNHLNPWLMAISNADFYEEWMTRYYTLLIKSDGLDGALNQMDEIASTYAAEFKKNYSKWPTLGQSLHPYSTSDVYSFQSQLDAKNFLKNWISNRCDYLKTIYYSEE